MSTKLTPENFNLNQFILGCTPETRFVPIYQDKRLMGEIYKAKADLKQAIEDEALLGKKSSVAETTKADKLRVEYEALLEKAEENTQVFEIHAVDPELRKSITNDFCKEKGISKAELAENLDLQQELDLWVLPHALPYPGIDSPEKVKELAVAIGEVQFAILLGAFAETLQSRVSLNDLTPDFLHKSSLEDDGETN